MLLCIFMGDLFMGLFHIAWNIPYICCVMLSMKCIFIIHYKSAAREYWDTRTAEKSESRNNYISGECVQSYETQMHQVS